MKISKEEFIRTIIGMRIERKRKKEREINNARFDAICRCKKISCK